MRKIAVCAMTILALFSRAAAGEIDATLFGHKVRVVDLRNDPDYWSKGLEVRRQDSGSQSLDFDRRNSDP